MAGFENKKGVDIFISTPEILSLYELIFGILQKYFTLSEAMLHF